MERISMQFTKFINKNEQTEENLKNIVIPFELEQQLKQENFLNFTLNPIDVQELANAKENEDEDDLTYEYEQFNYNENFKKMEQSFQENLEYKKLIQQLAEQNKSFQNRNLELYLKIFSYIPSAQSQLLQSNEQQSFYNKLFFLNYDFQKNYVLKSEEQDKKAGKLLEEKILENQQLKANLDKLQSKLKKQENQFQAYLKKGKPQQLNQQQTNDQSFNKNEEEKSPQKQLLSPSNQNQNSININIIETKENNEDDLKELNEEIEIIKQKLDDQTPPFKESDHVIIVKNAVDLDAMSLTDSVSTMNTKLTAKSKVVKSMKQRSDLQKSLKMQESLQQQQPKKMPKKPTVAEILKKGKKK